jgi:hypothetical protein
MSTNSIHQNHTGSSKRKEKQKAEEEYTSKDK